MRDLAPRFVRVVDHDPRRPLSRLVDAVFTLGSYWFSPGWYDRVVLPEGYGILEISHFIIPLIGLCIALRLLFDPFVRARPLVLTVTIIGALSCLYIAGEEMSWGQHFFHWNTPEYWAELNRQEETNLHNTYAVFEKMLGRGNPPDDWGALVAASQAEWALKER